MIQLLPRQRLNSLALRSGNHKFVVNCWKTDHRENVTTLIGGMRVKMIQQTPRLCLSDNRKHCPTSTTAMPPSISALSPKEEENVKEVLGMRCRAACRPYLEGMSLSEIFLTRDFTECATGRTVSMAWACRQKRRRMMACIQA